MNLQYIISNKLFLNLILKISMRILQIIEVLVFQQLPEKFARIQKTI